MLNYSDRQNYQTLNFVSTKKIQPLDFRTGTPAERAKRFAQFLNDFAEVHNLTQTRIAEITGYNPSRVNQWFTGKHIPDDTIIDVVLRKLGVAHGFASEPPADYKAPPRRTDQKYFDALEDILNSGDQEVADHIKRQLLLLQKRIVPSKSTDEDGK